MLLTLINTEMMRGEKKNHCSVAMIFFFNLILLFLSRWIFDLLPCFLISKRKRKTSSDILEDINIEQNCSLAQIRDSFKTLYCAFLVASQSTAVAFHCGRKRRVIILFGCYPQVPTELMESLRNSNL